MQLPEYTFWIFALILILLALLALFPSPFMIGMAVIASSALIILQTIIILRDGSSGQY